jgi:carbon monoxide dehydrogenase subunit G
MDMQASRQLAVTQQQAWDALNDPEVLKVCIPGCDRVEATGPENFAVGVALKIGPVSARFNGKIALGDMSPPHSYTLSFDGQGGAAGFGKGTAKVVLTPNEGGCELAYTVHAQVGGKVAQLGQRLVDGAAKSMSEDFFKRFDNEMQRRFPPMPVEAAAAPVAPAAEPAAPGGKVPVWVWVAGAVVLAAVWWWSR